MSIWNLSALLKRRKQVEDYENRWLELYKAENARQEYQRYLAQTTANMAISSSAVGSGSIPGSYTTSGTGAAAKDPKQTSLVEISFRDGTEAQFIMNAGPRVANHLLNEAENRGGSMVLWNQSEAVIVQMHTVKHIKFTVMAEDE